MKRFSHINAATIDEAVSALASGNARVIAGGTDLLSVLKDEILPVYPERVVNIKTIPGMSFVKEEEGVVKIGALTLLDDIARNETIRERYPALAEAAARTAHPHIREMGTVGGNICQLPRCWYFRLRNNRFFCRRKGGKACPAATGDARYHSIFGGISGCIAVNPSDLAPALIALDAKIKTTKRLVDAEIFFSVEGYRTTILDSNEIVTEIELPQHDSRTRSFFIKYALRKSIDFAIVNCAALVGPTSARVCLNAVANNPYRAASAEKLVAGRQIDEALAEAAGEAALSGAKPLPSNAYKVQIAKTLVKRAILGCR